MKKLIKRQKSIIIAADVPHIKALETLVKNTCRVEGIGAYKIGLELVLSHGLPKLVSVIRKHTNLSIIYDQQKAATDIPEMGKRFAKACQSAGVDSVILFPFGGVKTEISWIKACQKKNLITIVGAHMTQPQFLTSQGGFINDNAPQKIFRIAAQNGVKNFVVPGNKPEYVKKYRQLLEKLLGKGNITLYAPGFIAQKGNISEAGKSAGKNWHAIVGRAIYQAKDQTKAAEEITRQIK